MTLINNVTNHIFNFLLTKIDCNTYLIQYYQHISTSTTMTDLNISRYGIQLKTSLGYLFVGHFDPVHKEDHMPAILKKIFNINHVVIGDFNANAYHLKLHKVIDNTYSHLDFPSYLPDVPDNKRKMFTPQFDNIVIKSPLKFTNDTKNMQMIQLPDQVYKNPRLLIKKLKLCSDHIPVQAVIVGGKERLSVATFNVADPFYWAQYHPSASNGFDASKEDDRLKSVVTTVMKLAEVNDVIGLQEVPYSLLPRLQTLAERCGYSMRCVPSDKVKDGVKCSHTVALQRI